jgi:transaldolase/glucose-6-phosphate isomerase
MSNNPLIELTSLGQSIWYDNIERRLITSGELKRMIEEDGLRGVTSNPAIFEKAISGSDDYLEQLTRMAEQQKSAVEIYEALAISDIQAAADVLAPVFEKMEGLDGYVSLECSPLLAHDTLGTIEEARRLWGMVNRKNVMIKIPGTPAGIPAIEEVIYEGINVNITLLFSIDSYEQTQMAYIRGLERRLAEGKSVSGIASVASFFVSRIDTAVDKRLDDRIAAARSQEEKSKLKSILGRVAIANAKMAYQRFKDVFHGERFARLKEAGAQVQRPLWASTSTKNPAYTDVYYVEALIGPETVDTIPPATFNAFRDHGQARLTLEEDPDEARGVLARLEEVGISLNEVTQVVLDQAVQLFIDPFEKLIQATRARRDEVVTRLGIATSVRQTISAAQYQSDIGETLGRLAADDAIARAWNKDSALWKNEPDHQKIIANSLGWLNVPEMMLERADEVIEFAEEVRAEGFRHVVLLGMGGSSLCPEVFRRTFGRREGYPELLVLDSTVPAAVRAVEEQIDTAKTLFIVASKSGEKIEPQVFQEYFFDRVSQVKRENPGRNFIAITDADTRLERTATDNNFRRVFLNPSDIGGRYSALSYFGIVPAAVAGYDIKAILERGVRAMKACQARENNPAAQLGAAIGALARKGRDKLTFIIPAPIDSLGLWIEQLIAESTGKEGVGILPVAAEPLGNASLYGDDRAFVYIRTRGSDSSNVHSKLAALESKGHPVITRTLNDPLDLGEEFFVWEFATALAGRILGINAFDQPNVQESLVNTTNVLEEYKRNGRLDDQRLVADEDSIRIYAGAEHSALLSGASERKNTMASILSSFLSSVRLGDYVAILAFIDENTEHEQLLEKMRLHIRDAKRVATTVGYGPRFLHSTGQLHKGGPATGVFLQITCEDSEDISIPGRPYSFGIIKQAQALGDFESLSHRNLRVIRIDVGKDTVAGLSKLFDALQRAIQISAGTATD